LHFSYYDPSAWHDAVMSSRAGLVGLVVLLLAAACSSDKGASTRAVPPAARQSDAGVPVTLDATLQGAPGWQLDRPANGREIEAFADQVSIRPGVSVGLYVSTSASAYTVQAFRIGAYRGSAARLVWTSGSEPGRRQAAAREVASMRTPYAPWQRSMQVPTRGWEPGDYLLKLQMAKGGQQTYVPLTVRSVSTAGRVVIVNSVTDWQAYNTWGGRSLYQGPDVRRATRAYAVSFDRPYGLGQGAADFLSNERPLVSFADSLALPLAFVTDVDLDQDPHLLDGARAVISPGHDEYYSTRMRAALTAARDRGTNIAFLAANSVFRHIRLAPTGLGPDRFEIDYKAYEPDPERLINPDEVTVQWPDPPHPRPESALTGAMYECNGVKTDMLVTDANHWPLAGTGLHDGQALHQLVGDEYDSYQPQNLSPAPIQVLFHSPLTCSGRPGHADTTYYTVPSGAGVFDAATTSWECALEIHFCPAGQEDAAAQQAIRAITKNLLKGFADGPAGRAHPATPNVPQPTQRQGYGMPGNPPPSLPTPSTSPVDEPGLATTGR